ncbi:MAG: elongation factor G [Candidatus Sumerlaeia bacterium]|nr:elongation factor G [Candidatus Sumerlaeia bacterium]
MKEYQTHQLRNVALAGHSGTGKTSLTEALLHIHGLVDRKGTVEAGSTQSDYDPLEKQRQCSINATLVPLEFDDFKINLLDCPGFRDFVGEIKNAIRISEMCLIVIDAETGVEVGTEFAWQFAHEYNIPVAILINKMDKERANFEQAMASIEQTFDAHTIPVTLPIGQGADFKGVIDLLDMKAIYESGTDKRVEDIPADMLEAAKAARKALIEAAAEGDDELTEKFLMEETLTEEEIRRGLREDLQDGRFIPVVCCSAEKEIGLSGLIHFIQEECPSPNYRKGFRCQVDPKDPAKGHELRALNPDEPFSAFVFKSVNDDFAGRLSFVKVVCGSVTGDCTFLNTRNGETMKAGHVFALRGKSQIAVPRLYTGDIGCFAKLQNVHTGDTLADPSPPNPVYEATVIPPPTVSMSIHAKIKSEEDKISMAIHRLLDQDSTLRIERDASLHQTILHGMGDTHLEVALDRLTAVAKVEIVMEPPKVQYRETITKKGQGQGKYKKQSGGRGQFGDCHVRLEPLPRGSGFEFKWEIVGGVIPTNFQSSVEKGIVEAMHRGIIAGYPMVDVLAACYDGSHHAVDSSDMAFQVAGSMAFKHVAPNCNPVLLEPIMKVIVTIPAAYMGDVMGYLSSHRGRISGNEQIGDRVVITSEVPQGEMAFFSRDLRSMTHGRSVFEATFSHYDPCPPQVQEKVVKDSSIKHEE